MKLHLPKSLLGVLFAGLMASAAQAAVYSGSFSGASAQKPLPDFTFELGAPLTLTVDACDKAYKAGGSAPARLWGATVPLRKEVRPAGERNLNTNNR